MTKPFRIATQACIPLALVLAQAGCGSGASDDAEKSVAQADPAALLARHETCVGEAGDNAGAVVACSERTLAAAWPQAPGQALEGLRAAALASAGDATPAGHARVEEALARLALDEAQSDHGGLLPFAPEVVPNEALATAWAPLAEGACAPTPGARCRDARAHLLARFAARLEMAD